MYLVYYYVGCFFISEREFYVVTCLQMMYEMSRLLIELAEGNVLTINFKMYRLGYHL